MTLRSFDYLRERIAKIKGIPEEAARKAAPVIEAQLRRDATTKRGNVPSFGAKGDVPITAKAVGASVVVTGPDWVMAKASELGQVDGWVSTIVDIADKELSK